MSEVWKDIKGFEGLYRISNCGRLSSHQQGNWNVLSNIAKTGWYLTVNLIKKKTRFTRRLHRLVYEAFVGEIPKGYHIHHKDGNKQNNHVENLQLLDVKSHHNLHIKKNPSIVNGMRIYNMYIKANPIYQYTLDGKFIGIYSNAREAGRRTGVCSRNILQVARQEEYKPGKTRKQAGGFVWKIRE